MRLLFSLSFLSAVFIALSAQAQDVSGCRFGFEIEAQTTAFDSTVIDGERKKGFWLTINRAPKELRDVSRFIGRLQICLTTADGQPAVVTRGGQTHHIKVPLVTSCTVTLLPGNRLLTNSHCYHEPSLVAAGLTVIKEARVNFGYTSGDNTGAVLTYPVAPHDLARDADLDAMLLQISGADAIADLGGHFPMRMMTSTEPFQELRMIHHPDGDPQQYSTGTCQVHRRQAEIGPTHSPFRHSCESMGGSSGSLLLDSRTLAIVALHNQGGLNSGGDSYNAGHKIAMIDAAFGLGMEVVPPSGTPDTAPLANSGGLALSDALLQPDRLTRLAALREVALVFRDSKAGETANVLADLMVTEAPDDTALAAHAALNAAMAVLDPDRHRVALADVISRFPDTAAAETAVVMRDRLAQEAAERREIDAQAALAEVLDFADPARQIAILDHVQARFGGTAAATKAAQIALRLRDGGALPATTLKQRIEGPVEVTAFGLTVTATETALTVCEPLSFTVQSSETCLLDVIYPDSRRGQFFRLSTAAIGNPILQAGEIRQIPAPGRALRPHTAKASDNIAVNCYPGLLDYADLGIDLMQALEDYARPRTKSFEEVVTDVTRGHATGTAPAIDRKAAPLTATITFSIAPDPEALDENGRCKP